MSPAATPGATPWWRRAVIYEIYIRSFADGDGDGIGDIAGVRSRLPYLGGIDGFRIDVAHGLVKAAGLPDAGSIAWPPAAGERVEHPHWDRDEVHEIYGLWRTMADAYEDPRVFVAEAWVHGPERLARAMSAPTSSTPLSTSTSCSRRGRPRRCASRSRPPCAPTRQWAPRPPGCSQTTTRSGSSCATPGRRA